MRGSRRWLLPVGLILITPLLAAPSCGEEGKCNSDGDCSDHVYCNGYELCRPTNASADSNGCIAGPPIECGTGLVCTEAATGCLPLCQTDADCNDRVFCNGVERCMPGAADADPRGCAGATPACSATQTCDEAMQRCVAGCSDDVDGDGRRSMACGGDDCDDNNPARLPGLSEVCDSLDQDCDPNTIGFQDSDGDQFNSATCCNGTLCGSDCDDTNPAIVPGALICSGIGVSSAYSICQSNGAYLTGKCPGTETCHPQPNGLGICF